MAEEYIPWMPDEAECHREVHLKEKAMRRAEREAWELCAQKKHRPGFEKIYNLVGQGNKVAKGN